MYSETRKNFGIPSMDAPRMGKIKIVSKVVTDQNSNGLFSWIWVGENFARFQGEGEN